jgi:hypothetical protein
MDRHGVEMNRRLTLAAASLTLIMGIAACRPVDSGAGGSSSPSPQASASESNAAPAAPTHAPEETPNATTGSDYGY